jgi:hypothetical protein
MPLDSRSVSHFDLAETKSCGDSHRLTNKGANWDERFDDLAAKGLQRATPVV